MQRSSYFQQLVSCSVFLVALATSHTLWGPAALGQGFAGKSVSVRALGNAPFGPLSDGTANTSAVSIQGSQDLSGTTVTGRTINGIRAKAKASIAAGTVSGTSIAGGSMGASSHVGGSLVTSLTPAGTRPSPWAITSINQAEYYRVDGVAGGTSQVDMRITLDGHLSRIGNTVGDLASVQYFGEYWMPSTFSGGDLFGFQQTLSTDSLGVTSMSSNVIGNSTAFDLNDWSNSFAQDTSSALPGEFLVTQANFDEIATGVLTVPNNTPFAVFTYLRTDAMSAGGLGNSSLSDFYDTATVGLTTPTVGSTLVRVTAVPEPSSCIALALVGLAGWAIRRRRNMAN